MSTSILGTWNVWWIKVCFWLNVSSGNLFPVMIWFDFLGVNNIMVNFGEGHYCWTTWTSNYKSKKYSPWLASKTDSNRRMLQPKHTLPETNIFAPENGWLEYDCSLLGRFPGLFSGANLRASFQGVYIWEKKYTILDVQDYTNPRIWKVSRCIIPHVLYTYKCNIHVWRVSHTQPKLYNTRGRGCGR